MKIEPNVMPLDTPLLVDASGLRCPLPLLRAKQALASIAVGQRILVKSTDPDSVKDFHAYTDLKALRLVHSTAENGHFTFLIEK